MAKKQTPVRLAFGERVAAALEPHGFKPLADGAFVRKLGKNRHRIETSLSEYGDGRISVSITPYFEDGLVRKVQKHWRAGGSMESTASGEGHPNDEASAVTQILGLLDFFALFEKPERVFEEVSRRYLPGLVSPLNVAPYLRVHLGEDAVLSYTEWMLVNRPELWPAFVAKEAPVLLSDHGTQLGALASFDPPPGTATTATRPPRSLRDFFGLQLRAWGEPKAAAALRTVSDEGILRARKEQEALEGQLVDSVPAVRVLLALTGEDRNPIREKPAPRYFQYHVLHPPFR